MNRKSLVSVFAMLAMVAALLGVASPAAAAGPVVLTINIQNTVQGATITVPILISSDVTQPTRGYQFDLAFDPSRLQAQSVSDGGFLTSVAGHGNLQVGNTPTIDNVGGHILGASWILTGGDGHGPTGSGTLANVVFTVPAGAPNGKAILTLSNVIISNESGSAQYPTTLNTKWVQVGPGPVLGLAIGFTPHIATSTFDVNVTVSNTGGSPSDPDTLALSLTNASPASGSISVPSIAAGANQTFSLNGVSLTGSTSTVTATLQNFGTSKQATYSPVSSSGQTKVDANFGAFLQITPSAQVTFGSLQLGQNSISGNLNVKCNGGYEVDAYDNEPNGFYMTEYTGSAYGSRKLSSALTVWANGFPAGVTAGSPVVLLTGGVAGQHDDTGQDFPLTYYQPLHYVDPLLPAGETYHTMITFNAYVTGI